MPICAECREGFDCSFELTQKAQREERELVKRNQGPRTVKNGVPPASCQNNDPNTSQIKLPASSVVANRGIRDSYDFIDFMAALMADVVTGKVNPKVAQAACMAAHCLLEAAKMQIIHQRDPENPVQFSLSPRRKDL